MHLHPTWSFYRRRACPFSHSCSLYYNLLALRDVPDVKCKYLPKQHHIANSVAISTRLLDFDAPPPQTMDIVLEVFDTFLFDALWATVCPGSHSHDSFKSLQNAASPTFSSSREMATGWPKPSTQFFRLEPSKYAYMSAWPRDNIFRQGITLYLITWYALCLRLLYQKTTELF